MNRPRKRFNLSILAQKPLLGDLDRAYANNASALGWQTNTPNFRFGIGHTNSVDVITYDANDGDDSFDNAFMIFVY